MSSKPRLYKHANVWKVRWRVYFSKGTRYQTRRMAFSTWERGLAFLQGVVKRFPGTPTRV